MRYVTADIGTNSPASALSRSESSLAAHAIRVMTDMKENGTIAFIGPDDTCLNEALVAAAWNLPMISYVSILVILNILQKKTSSLTFSNYVDEIDDTN